MFNKKLKNRIIELEDKYETLFQYCKNIDVVAHQIKYAGLGDAPPEYSILHYLTSHLVAIEEYLKIKIESKFVDDPNCRPEPPEQIRKWIAVKLNKK